MQDLETLKGHEGHRFSVGEKISGTIEAMFPKGILISFTDSVGDVYRGVLVRDSSLFHSRCDTRIC